MGNVGGHGSHVERLRETPNAELARYELNQRLAGSESPVADVQARFEEVGITPRKGAVLAIDVFITASPEHFPRNHPDDLTWQAFQAKAMQFLADEYGAANVVHAMAHHDETSPHLHAIITPIRTKVVKVGRTVKTERIEHRLCAKDWLGGERITLSKLQTRFAQAVADLGLKRGIAGSRATHTQVKQFYAVVQETVGQAQVIHQALAPIDPDYFVRSVPKPGLLDLATPRQFAQTQVGQALGQLAQQIEQTNANAAAARRGQLVALQTPVLDGLAQKGNTRQSQAEKALKQLGYRLDQHGQLVNIEEERKTALRATISASVGKCTDPEGLRAELALKGVRLTFHKERPELIGNRPCNGAAFSDGKGERVWGSDLGAAYTTASLLTQMAQVGIERERQAKEKAYRASLDDVLAQIFKRHGGDCHQVQQYLAKRSPAQQAQFLAEFGQLHGPAGDTYARQRFEALNQMGVSQLATVRESLRGQYDVGQRQGPKVGR